MKKVFINIITFIPKVIDGIFGLLLILVLILFINLKMGIRKVFGFLTCDGL
jgi:hypothetical protein